MKRVLALVCVLLSASAIYAASVEPQTINGIALVRGASSVVVTTNAVFIQGDPLLITNLTLYADTAGVVAQDLTDLSVQVGIGNATTATCITHPLSLPPTARAPHCSPCRRLIPLTGRSASTPTLFTMSARSSAPSRTSDHATGERPCC